MGDGHYRHNRRTRNLIKTLKSSRSNAVRAKILEELKREFDKMNQSKLGRALSKGAIGVSGWGKRTYARGERYAKSPAPRGSAYNRLIMGLASVRSARLEGGHAAGARAKARQDRREERKVARQTRAKQKAARQAQREKNPATTVVGRVKAARAGRNGQMSNGGNGTVTRTSSPRTRKTAATTGPQQAKRADPPKRTTPSRPAADARAARAAKPAARTPALPSETIRAPRSSRASRTPRSGGSASKTG
jgi:hypothetical protein